MSIMQTRYFELSNPATDEHKFFELTLHENGTLHSRYGRIGAHGQSKTQHFASTENMLIAADKTITEKLGKGYRPAAPGATAAQETRHQRILRCARSLYELISNGNADLAQRCSADFKQYIEDEDNKEEFENQDEALIATGFKEAADWELIFFVDRKDSESMLDALETLRANLDIDIRFAWGCEHPEDEFNVAQIMQLAHAQLQEIDYALWRWDADEDAYLGWIAHDDNDDRVAKAALALGFKAAYTNSSTLA